MEFIVSFKHPEKVIKEDELKHCRVWTMDFSEQTRTPIEDSPDITILPENNEIDINQQDKVNLFNNFKLQRPANIPQATVNIEESTEIKEEESEETKEEDKQSVEGSAPDSVQEEPPSSVKSEDISPAAIEEPPSSVKSEDISPAAIEEPPAAIEEPKVSVTKDPLEQISDLINLMKAPIIAKREKLTKVKDMILSTVDIDDDIQPTVDNFLKQIEEQNKKENDIKDQILKLF